MDTLVNFRDIGGIKNKTGKTVIPGKIFRSGEIVHLSPEDTKAFTDTYHIKTIFDFRGVEEIRETPDDTFPGVTYRHIDILKDASGHSASFNDMLASEFSAAETMQSIYQDFIRTEASLNGYKAFLEEISEPATAPFIFHCFAGKDRTGLAAALILGILEVDKDAIMHDYLLTNAARKPANEGLLQQLKAANYEDKQLKEFEEMLYVKADYLETAYQTMQADYHDFDNFLHTGLKITDETIQKIRLNYLG